MTRNVGALMMMQLQKEIISGDDRGDEVWLKRIVDQKGEDVNR